MSDLELSQQTKFLEAELGPCVLVVKCYELLGRQSEARAMARQLTGAELDFLAQTIEKKLGYGFISEQFLRAIYVFGVAEMPQQITSLFRSFVETAKRSVKSEGMWDGLRAFRLAVGQIMARDYSSLSGIVVSECFGAAVSRAWLARSNDLMQQCLDDLQDAVDIAENDDVIAPWDDVWEYVLMVRIKRLLLE